MAKNGPILLIEDDHDDQMVIREVLHKIEVPNELKCFSSAGAALEYLHQTNDRPFMIISNVHLHKIDGIEMRRKIEEVPELKDKSIPFVFMSTDTRRPTVKDAYQLTVQGYFRKEDTLENLIRTIKVMFDYWTLCIHPNVEDAD